MALNPTKTASNPRIAKLIELEVAGRIKPEHQQELDTYRAQGLAPARAGGDLSEGQSKSTGFYNRALGSNRDFEASGIAAQPRSVLAQTAVNILPENITNSFASDERQKADQAKEDFIRASLRYESGAAIAPSEFTGQDRVFFPQPGDGPQVIAQKAQARQRVIESLKVTAGPGSSALTPQSQNTLVPAEQAPQQAAGVSELTAEQTAALQAVAQSGGTQEQIIALARSFARNVTTDNAAALAKFYANPANRNVRPVINDDTTIKPVDAGDGALGAAARGAGDTLTFGFLDEAGALADTVTRGGTYNDALNRRRGMAAYDEQNNGGSRLAGQVVGSLALPSFGASGVRQLATLGAGYGAAYGLGSSDGDVGDRLLNAGVTGTTGAVAGGGLGYLGGLATARLGRTPPTGGDGAKLLEAAQRQGVSPLPADVGGPMTRRFTSAAAQVPLSAGPIIRGGQRVAAETMAARDRVAASVGNAVDPYAAGEVAQEGARNYIAQSRGEVGRLYGAARETAGNVRAVPQKAINKVDANLTELAETPSTSAPVTRALTSLRDDLSNEGGLSIDGLRRLRTNVRGQASTDELRGTDYQRRAGQVLDAISDDIADNLPSAEARAQFRAADVAHRQRIETIDEVIKPIIGGRNDRAFAPERVYQNLQNISRSDSGRLRRFVDTLQPDEANSLRATVISQLGSASHGEQNAEGNAFSASQFLTQWNRMSPRAKDTLFRGEARDALNDLVKIAEGTKQAQSYANRSNTGGAILGNVGALFGIGSVSPTTAIAGGAAQMVSGRLLASPAFARWLARPVTTPQQIENAARRLGTIASRNPEIANDLLPIQRALQEMSPRAAASQNKQDRR